MRMHYTNCLVLLFLVIMLPKCGSWSGPPQQPHPQQFGPPQPQHGPGGGPPLPPPPASCDDMTSPRCVCNMMATVDYMNEMASVPYSELHKDPEIVPRRIGSYHCVRASLLPETLRLTMTPNDENGELRRNYYSSRRKMRVRRSLATEVANNTNGIELSIHQRSKRQISLGYPSDALFFEILPKLETKSNHFYIPLGGGIKIPCGPGSQSQNVIEAAGGNGRDGEMDESSFRKIYEWSHSDGRAVSGPEVSLNPRNGDMTFASVSLSDSDLYSCNISHISKDHHSDYEDVNEGPPMETHYQQLDVVAEPIQWLRFVAEYYTTSCSRDELTLINSHLVGWVHNHVCFFCPVRNHSVSCVSNDEDGDEGGQFVHQPSPEHDKRVLLRFAVSTLGVERRMMAFTKASDACPLPCIELLHVKILQIVRDSLEKLFRLRIEVESQEMSDYVPGAISNDLVMACPSGFFAEHKLCFPCDPGHFSPNGNSECFLCGIGSFQPTPGSGMCLPCPDGYSTIDEGSVGEFECKIGLLAATFAGRLWRKYYPYSFYLAILLGILALLLFLACIIPCLCPRTWMGRCCAGVSCCGPDPDFDDSKKRHNKRRDPGATRRRSYERIEDYSDEDDEEDNERTRTRTRKIVHEERIEESPEESDEGALNQVRILPAQVVVDDENRVVEVDVAGEVDARRTGRILIKDHFLYQPVQDRGQVQNYVTTSTRHPREQYNIPLKRVQSRQKIPKPPPLPPAPISTPETTSYWTSTPKNKNFKLQQSSLIKPKKYPISKLTPVPEYYSAYSKFKQEQEQGQDQDIEDYRIVQQSSHHIRQTPPPTSTKLASLQKVQSLQKMEPFPKLRHVEAKKDPSSGDRKSKIYIFSTDDEHHSQSETRPKYHSVRDFTMKLDNSAPKKRVKKNVYFHPVPKTRLIPSRAAEKAAAAAYSSSESYVVAISQESSDDDKPEMSGRGDNLQNVQKVGHVSIRPDNHQQQQQQQQRPPRMEMVNSKLASPTSSEFDINAPINVRKIASRLEKRRRFSAGMLEDLTTRGKIPPGAFTYTPPLPMTKTVENSTSRAIGPTKSKTKARQDY